MYKHLFFDDRFLFGRENIKRCYGTPELIESAVYYDKNASTTLSGPWVFKTDTGCFRMLYQGILDVEREERGLFSAISNDGIHFVAEQCSTSTEGDRQADNCLLVLKGEVACIIEDPFNGPDERYKMLFTEIDTQSLTVPGILYVSPDLVHWTRVEENRRWSDDGEPLVGVFYNKKKQCYTILKRPGWGVRLVGYTETNDWKTFTPYTLCLQQDSLDQPLEELYGMPSFEYDDWYIGFLHIYGGFGSSLGAKYRSGTIKAQLAYSHNGNNWMRSLRQPFIREQSTDNSEDGALCAPMIWPTTIYRSEDDIFLYAAASMLEHGAAFHEPGANGRIYVYKIRKDGFVKLETDCEKQVSVVSTRENVWHGGELHVNIKAENVTVAVYQSDRSDNVFMNVLGICEVVAGYSHEDCVPFSGDLCNWVPQFKNGKTIDELKGKVLAFEIRFYNGELYSIYGDMTPVFNVEGEKYRQHKKLPSYF